MLDAVSSGNSELVRGHDRTARCSAQAMSVSRLRTTLKVAGVMAPLSWRASNQMRSSRSAAVLGVVGGKVACDSVT